MNQTSETNRPRILMYHAILSSKEGIPENREVGAELYDVSLGNFRDQVMLLKERGYCARLLSDDQVKEQEIVITFDDGEMNNFTQAYPVLKEFNLKAYFFIIAKRIGKEGYMGWVELRELHNHGMVIGSHGLSHEILTNLKDSQLEEELTASKKNLERNLDIEVDSFSIPRGFCNDNVIEMAKSVGYKYIFISDRPRHLTQDCFSRVAIKGNWAIERFAMAIDGKVPFSEIIKDKIKRTAKFILRESGYNFVRGLIIKVLK